MELIFLVFQILFAVFFLYLCVAFVTGAPFVPSTQKTSECMIALSGCKAGENIIDLGSGDGRLVRLAAAKGAHALGVEINPFLVWYSGLFHYSSGTREPHGLSVVTFGARTFEMPISFACTFYHGKWNGWSKNLSRNANPEPG